MPYKDISDLPEKVQHCLPKEAQKIYMEAFNHAYKQYQDPIKRMGTLEETTHRVAWSAVKKKFHKSEVGKWVKNK